MLCSIQRASVFLYLHTPLAPRDLAVSPSPSETFRSTYPRVPRPLLPTSPPPLTDIIRSRGYASTIYTAHTCATATVRVLHPFAVAPPFTGGGLTSRGNSAGRNFLALSCISRWRHRAEGKAVRRHGSWLLDARSFVTLCGGKMCPSLMIRRGGGGGQRGKWKLDRGTRGLGIPVTIVPRRRRDTPSRIKMSRGPQ